MDTRSLNRRKVLNYLGLGAIGAGAAGLIKLSTEDRLLASNGQPLQSVPPVSDRSMASEPSNTEVAAASGPMLAEFQGISQWLNSPPLTLADLRGQVVLLQFWTFACINCQRTLPYVVRWHQRYAPKGLKVIGVHTPELAFEYKLENVKDAVKQRGITYPVPIDNEYKTWSAYRNEYWPHLFLADRQGKIRYDHIGEGAYDRTEQMIQKLLG